MAPMDSLYHAFPNDQGPLISHNLPFPEACRKYVDGTFHASKVYIICSGSLAKHTSSLKDLQHALGGKVAGVRIGMKPHTFVSEVLEVVHDARMARADLIVTFGGGSLIDAAKLVAFAMSNDVHTEADLMALPHVSNPTAKALPPKCYVISIPSTLSGGEFSNYAGVTRDRDGQKFQFSSPLMGPVLVIFDADLAVTTPLNIWSQTGIRAIDHCVESFCNLERVAEVDEACVKGLQRLIPGLLLCKSDASDSDARQECQLAVPCAMTCLHKGVFPGASHGIGHQLGPLGVGHGETSCVLLPAVCKWNAAQKANVERQELMAAVFWGVDVAREAFEARGLEEGRADLGDLIDAIVRELGLPRSLKEVGVGRDGFEALAVNSLEDKCTQANPARIERVEQVLEILEMCA